MRQHRSQALQWLLGTLWAAAALVPSMPSWAADPVDAKDLDALKKLVGTSAVVAGTVTNAGLSANTGETVLVFTDQRIMIAIIPAKDADAVLKPLGGVAALVGKRVQVTGTVLPNTATGGVGIVVTEAGKLALAEEKPKPAAPPVAAPAQPAGPALDPAKPAELLKLVGKETKVRGKIVSAGRPGGKGLTLGFGPGGLTVTFAPAAAEAALKAVDGKVEKLKDREVECSGVVQKVGAAPAMNIEQPSQFALVDDAAKPKPEDKPKGKVEPAPLPVPVGTTRLRTEENFARPAVAKLAEALKDTKYDQKWEYEPKELSVQAHIPKSYRPGMPMGLMVWIDPRDTPEFGNELVSPYEERMIIVVSPTHAGQDQPLPVRMMRALDSARIAMRMYSVDPDRVYVGGFANGGIVATEMSLMYPDVFRAAVCVQDVGYFKNIPVPGKPKEAWGANMPAPPQGVLNDARRRVRMLLVLGEKNTNLKITKARAEALKKDVFGGGMVTVEVTGLVNGMASAKDMAPLVRGLESGLAAGAKASLAKAVGLEKAKKTVAAYDAYCHAAAQGAGEKFAGDAVAKAHELYSQVVEEMEKDRAAAAEAIGAGRFPDAHARVRKLREEYGKVADAAAADLDKAFADAKQLAKGNPARTPTGPAAPGVDPQAEEKRDGAAAKALKEAEELLLKDPIKGYLAMKALSNRFRDAPAGRTAAEKMAEIEGDEKRIRPIRLAIEEQDAAEELQLAENFIKLKKLDDAKEALRKIVRKHPKTKAAEKAKALLDEIAKAAPAPAA